ncbi:MAG TPA: histidine ammonia-lyase [Flavobacteriales bacterium]|nr:histidine ammonia-lyase [Flavobacteriales bacterium]
MSASKTYNLEKLDTHWVYDLVQRGHTLQTGEQAQQKIEKCYSYLHNKLKKAEKPIYGINTGFGSLCDTVISNDQLQQLQENLVKSHACGMGDLVPVHIVKNMMVLKIINMSLGHSGVKTQTVNLLTEMYNNNIIPVIYQQGSLGASGDLAPLAHLTLPLIGLGEVFYNGDRTTAEIAFKNAGLSAIKLDAKEGLALLNGTQFMGAYGVEIVEEFSQLLSLANLIAAVSIEAFDARPEPFNPLVHRIRAHAGQLHTAEQINHYLEGSELFSGVKEHVQDPYSFRCIPQVHGASYDVLQNVKNIFNTEINSVSDNPTIFPDEDLIISAGNFHGQPLAIALDSLAIAIAELGSISERRIYKLISGQRGLPAFLVKKPGINSGFMIPQYTAAGIVSQSKQLCTPASVDTIDSSNGQEDHVSMGANAATKCYRVLENTKRVLAIELLNACQALEFRNAEKSSKTVQHLLAEYRRHVPFVEDDVLMKTLMDSSLKYLENKRKSMS